MHKNFDKLMAEDIHLWKWFKSKRIAVENFTMGEFFLIFRVIDELRYLYESRESQHVTLNFLDLAKSLVLWILILNSWLVLHPQNFYKTQNLTLWPISSCPFLSVPNYSSCYPSTILHWLFQFSIQSRSQNACLGWTEVPVWKNDYI